MNKKKRKGIWVEGYDSNSCLFIHIKEPQEYDWDNDYWMEIDDTPAEISWNLWSLLFPPLKLPKRGLAEITLNPYRVVKVWLPIKDKENS